MTSKGWPEIDLPEGSSPYSDEAYAQGARSLERLIAERVLVREDKPTFYIYRMVMDGRTQTGVGLAASVRAYERLGFKIAADLRIDIGHGFVMDDYRMEKSLAD